MDYHVTGTCRYCGQMSTVNASEPYEGQDADSLITNYCTCDGARRARKSVEVRGNVGFMLGEESVDMGFDPEGAQAIEAIDRLIDFVLDGLLIEATARMPGGDICKIKLDKHGELQVTRTLKRQRTM